MRAMRCAFLASALFLQTPRWAIAKVPASIEVNGNADGCPTPDAVALELRRLLPRSNVTTARSSSVAVMIELNDLGSSHRVLVDGSARELTDELRQCGERARAAAVFAVLVLEPPIIDLPETDTATEAPARVTSASSTASPASPAIEARGLLRDAELVLEIGGAFDAAPTANPSGVAVSGGGAMRLAIGGELFGIAIGGMILSPTVLELDSTRVRILRVPFDVDLRLSVSFERVDIVAEVGLSTTILVATGLEDGARAQGTRFELGLRGAVLSRVWFGDLAPFISLQSTFTPAPYELVVRQQVVGRSPQIWLGGVAGLCVKLH